MEGHTYASRDILDRMLDKVLAVEPEFEPRTLPPEKDLNVDASVALFQRLRAALIAHEPPEEPDRYGPTIMDWSSQHRSVFSVLSRVDAVLLKANRDQYTCSSGTNKKQDV